MLTTSSLSGNLSKNMDLALHLQYAAWHGNLVLNCFILISNKTPMLQTNWHSIDNFGNIMPVSLIFPRTFSRYQIQAGSMWNPGQFFFKSALMQNQTNDHLSGRQECLSILHLAISVKFHTVILLYSCRIHENVNIIIQLSS